MTVLANIRGKINWLKKQASTKATVTSAKYYSNPRLYAKEQLGLDLTEQQEQGLLALVEPPFKVLIRAGHAVGKSTLVAVAISWIYDTRKVLYGIITAPKESQIKDIVWRELRKLRNKAGLGGFTGPSSLTLQDAQDHIFSGTTARDTHGFQGKHELNTFVFMDEAQGIDKEFFEAAETMVTGEGYGQIIILNPLSTSCQAYREEKSGAYKVLVISCLDHPNIGAELRGDSAPYPSAVRLQRVVEWIKKWSDPIEKEDAERSSDEAIPLTAFEFPRKGAEISDEVYSKLERLGLKIIYEADKTKDGKWVVYQGQWWRAGPECESRVLGLWPSAGVNAIWSELLFDKCRRNVCKIRDGWKTKIGCDVARYGDDLTEIAVRRGPCLIHLESHSGWGLDQITGRLKQLCHLFPGPQKPREVLVLIDETGGLGAGPVDFADGYNFYGVNVAKESSLPDSYVNLRTELWFATRDMARSDIGLDFSRINPEQALDLQIQLVAQKYKISPKTGQSQALDKDEIKKELGRSPDTADAVNLAYYQPGG